MSGSEVSEWIAKHLETEVTPQQVQRAMRTLEKKGWVRREKRWTHAWNHAYSYARAERRSTNDATVVAEGGRTTQKPTDRTDPEGRTDESLVTHQICSISALSTKKISKGDVAADEPLWAVPTDATPTGKELKEERIAGWNYPTPLTPRKRSLKDIQSLCDAIGRGEVSNPAVNPQKTQVGEQGSG